MAAPIEILLTSETSGQLFNISVWDPHSFTQLATFKGGSSTPKTLCFLRQDFILSAVLNRPLIHVWSLHRKDQVQQRMTSPGHVTALAASPDGSYCVAGIEEKLHVWQVSTGNLLAVISRHYQTINCVKFTDDGSHFVSAGEDNLVLVWSLARVLSSETGQQSPDPTHLWSQHSLPITDLHIGVGGVNARVVTASLDQTVRLWSVSSGEHLCTFIFDHPILSVISDAAEMRIFAGASNGNIYQVNLFEKPVRSERHITDDATDNLIFVGHSKQVGCLAMSMDGTLLASGSSDSDVRLWDVMSRQCIRTITHKGAITNLNFSLTPHRLLTHDSAKTSVVAPKMFKRYLHGSQRMRQEAGEEVETETWATRIQATAPPTNPSQLSGALEEECFVHLQKRDSEKPDPVETQQQLAEEVQHLKQVNRDIYKFTLSNILQNSGT